MPSVRMAAARAIKVDVEVEGMVALMREAGTGRFIDAMLDFCRTCFGADFDFDLRLSGSRCSSACRNGNDDGSRECPQCCGRILAALRQ